MRAVLHYSVSQASGELRDRHIRIGKTAISKAVERRMPIQIPDIQKDPSAVLDIIVRAGFRALLIVPLLGTERVIGALVVRRKQPGEFSKITTELLQTFAAQSVLAIQNARLFDALRSAPANSPSHWKIYATHRTASSRHRSLPRWGNSPQVSPTRSKTRSISSTISRDCPQN